MAASIEDPLDPPARTHRQILTDIADREALAVALERRRRTVDTWVSDGLVPARHWAQLEALGHARPGEMAAGRPETGRKRARPGRPRGPAKGALVAAGAREAAPGVGGGSARRARYDLTAFVRLIDVPGVGRGRRSGEGPLKLAAHHRYWLKILERVEAGDLQRVMCFMPPGAAKSTYAVDVFTPWFLAKGDDRSVLVVTYASDLAVRRGRRARAVARQPVFRQVFGVGPLKSHAGAGSWSLDNRSDWMGAGILAGLTGNRADLIVIDDPVKGRAEADSALIRRRTREEFDDTVRTRLKAGGRIVLIQTRWHEDDLAGQLLPADYDGRSGPVACRDGEVWEVVNLPAQAERADDPLGRAAGEYLWPEYWGPEHWSQFRVNPRTWNALFQQRPRPDEGSYFERSKFRRFADPELPADLRYYGASDYAVSEGRGDYTRLTVWGLDDRGGLWRVAAWGGQTSADVWIEAQVSLIERFRPLGGIRRWFGEAGVIQKAVGPMLLSKMRERRVHCDLKWLASSQDKPARARAAQSLVMAGRVHVRDDADGDCFIEECVAFPAGRHDDEVDCLSLIGRALDQLSLPVRGPVDDYASAGRVFEDPMADGDEGSEFARTGPVFGD
ncbi:MAG: hypothetical protein GC145_03870 [Caulobacter sp.]|nr:hypothetical protein [Caulobacter sp.]